jgi:hypothetical protein
LAYPLDRFIIHIKLLKMKKLFYLFVMIAGMTLASVNVNAEDAKPKEKAAACCKSGEKAACAKDCKKACCSKDKACAKEGDKAACEKKK